MGFAELVDKEGNAISPSGLPTVGTSFSPQDVLVAGRAPVGPDEIVIDNVTAAKDGFAPGDQIKVLFQGVVREFIITGAAQGRTTCSASTTASFDLETAQQLLGEDGAPRRHPRPGRAGRIDGDDPGPDRRHPPRELRGRHLRPGRP